MSLHFPQTRCTQVPEAAQCGSSHTPSQWPWSLGLLGAWLCLLRGHSRLFLRYEHTDSEVAYLWAVLVLHNQPVFAGVEGAHAADAQVGSLAGLELETAVAIWSQGLLILQPWDLWSWVAPHDASEIKCLQNRFYEKEGDSSDVIIQEWSGGPVWPM